MTNTYTTTSPSINTISSILPGSTVGSTITLNSTTGTGYTLSSGSAGQVYTTIGSNSASWMNTNTTFSNGNSTLMSIPHGEDKIVLAEKATLEVKGNIKLNGIDLEERLKTIEKVLLIPERDAILEKKYPKLKKMHDEYIKALGKYRTFEAIKGEDE